MLNATLCAGLVPKAEDWRWGLVMALGAEARGQTTAALCLPVRRPANWLERVNEPLTDGEIASVRRSAQRGKPLGEPTWVESIARRLNLESTLRPRGRPTKKEACPLLNSKSTIMSLSSVPPARSRTLWRSSDWACSMASMKTVTARSSSSDSAHGRPPSACSRQVGTDFDRRAGIERHVLHSQPSR